MTTREQLEQAIAAQESLRETLGDAIVDATIDALREKLGAVTLRLEQQRKLVTVLFADVSGFTAMSETMDAEDVNETMNALWERLDNAITSFGGYIDKHIGDAVMAIWGVEAAKENDPEQAIRAALDMQAELSTFRENHDVKLAMRIGINTGPVLLGEVGTTSEFTAIGDAVNVASRLEHVAPVGSILISHDTYQHVRGIFDVEPLDSFMVKGKAKPIQVYIIKRAKPRAFRRATRGVEGIETQMIGREKELNLLKSALEVALKNSTMQMVMIVGEAGMGKSRLVYEFENWVDLLPQEVCFFKGRAGLETQHIPFALIRDLFLFRYQIRDDDQSSAVREKIEKGIGEVLREDSQSKAKAHFIGQLLNFDFNYSPHLEGVLNDPQQIYDRALVYMTEFFRELARQNPVIILLEDIHWADDSSLEAIYRLALALREQRVLIIGATRPALFERRPQWGDLQTFQSTLHLHPLSKNESRRLVEEILKKVENIPGHLIELIIANAEDNPFYVEELIKMLIEEGVINKEVHPWRVTPNRLTEVHIPWHQEIVSLYNELGHEEFATLES